MYPAAVLSSASATSAATTRGLGKARDHGRSIKSAIGVITIADADNCPDAVSSGGSPRNRRPQMAANAYDSAAPRTAIFASVLPLANAPGPIITATPTTPANTPSSRDAESFSSVVVTCATRTVKRGVVALRIAANPEAIWV